MYPHILCCDNSGTPHSFVPIAAFPQTDVTVIGTAIPQARPDVMISEQKAQGAPDSEQLRNAVKEELVRREVLVQEARKKGLEKAGNVQAQVELARQAVLIRAYLQDYVKAHPVTDAEIKAEYEKIKSQLGDNEYKARLFLVEKEEEAKAIIWLNRKLDVSPEDIVEAVVAYATEAQVSLAAAVRAFGRGSSQAAQVVLVDGHWRRGLVEDTTLARNQRWSVDTGSHYSAKRPRCKRL